MDRRMMMIMMVSQSNNQGINQSLRFVRTCEVDLAAACDWPAIGVAGAGCCRERLLRRGARGQSNMLIA